MLRSVGLRFANLQISSDFSVLLFSNNVENPDSDDPLSQVGLTPAAKIELTLLPNIRMTPVDGMSAGDFICIFEFRFGRRGYNSKKHEHKVKKHSPMLRIGDGHQKYQLCF